MAASSNQGKFIDRTPFIRPAGKVFADGANLSECLKYYRLIDEVDAVKNELGVEEKEKAPKCKVERTVNTRNQGIFTESRPCLRPHVQTRYQTVINELQSTSYKSYWDAELGRTRDPTGGLPAGMDAATVTFGKRCGREYGVKELVNPPKTVYEVLWDSQIGHEMYRRTHNDYNPGEHVNRKYLEPAFDPNRRYGRNTIYDPRGIWAECACTWHEREPVVPVNQIQADVANRKRHQLGKCLEPNENIKCVPEGFTFLKPCERQMYGVEDLLKDPDIEPCLFKRDFMDWMQYLSELRSYIKRRRVDLKNLRNSILFYDKENKGWVPASVLYEVCKCHRLNFNYDKMDALTSMMGIQCDGLVDYDGFINLIDVNGAPLEIKKVQDIPEKNLCYITTNMAASRDYLTKDNRCLPVAGLPTVRTDLPRPAVPPGHCKADLVSLGDETTAAAIVNPSVYTNYGLSHRDFLLPRRPEFLRTLFGKLGYKFPGDLFEQLWKIGLDLDKTGFVCIDTFKMVLEKAAPSSVFRASEQDDCS